MTRPWSHATRTSRFRSAPKGRRVHPSVAARARYSADLSLRHRVVHDLAADHRHQRLDVLDLIGWDGEIVAVEHQEIGIFAVRERAEVTLLEQEAGVRARVRDQGFLACDGLPIDLAPADHLAGHGEAQG